MKAQQTPMRNRRDPAIQLSLSEWITGAIQGREVFFMTLTTKRAIAQSEFEETIRHWLRRLKTSYLGRSAANKEIFFFVVFEKTYNEQLHAHVLIDDISKLPSDKTFKCMEPFKQKAVDEWVALDSAGVRSAQDIQASFDSQGALGYLLKDVWNNVSLDRVPFNLISLPNKYNDNPSHVPWIKNKAKRMRVLKIKPEGS